MIVLAVLVVLGFAAAVVYAVVQDRAQSRHRRFVLSRVAERDGDARAYEYGRQHGWSEAADYYAAARAQQLERHGIVKVDTTLEDAIHSVFGE